MKKLLVVTPPKRLKPFIFSGLAFFVAGPILAQGLSLEEATAQAIANSYRLRADSMAISMASARQQQMTQARLPQVSAAISYLRISDNITPFAVQFPTGEVTLNPQILDQSYNALQVRQLLWAGGTQRMAETQAGLETKVRQLALGSSQQELAYYAKTIWYRLYGARQSQEILKASIEALQAQQRQAQQLLTNGMLLQADLLKISLEIARLQKALTDVDNAIVLSRYELGILVGATDRASIDIAAEPPPPPAVPSEVTAALPLALRQRQDLQAFTLNQEQAALATRQQKAMTLPNLSLGAMYNYDRPNQRLFPIEARFTGTWQAGLQLQWRISELYQNKARVQEARLAEDRLQAFKQQAVQGVEMEVVAAIQELKRSATALELSRQAVQLAEENYRLEGQRLKAGTTTVAELVRAHAQWLQARLNLVVDKANTDLAYHLIQKVTHSKL